MSMRATVSEFTVASLTFIFSSSRIEIDRGVCGERAQTGAAEVRAPTQPGDCDAEQDGEWMRLIKSLLSDLVLW